MAGSRDYKAEYRRRQQRARARGFTGYAQQRRYSPKVRSKRDFARLPEGARSARTDALHVLRVARDRGISIEEAARIEHVPAQVVRWWAGDAVGPTRRGASRPRHGDRLLRLRPLFIEGSDRVEFVEIRGSNAARRADRILDVQARFMEGRASEAELDTIHGQRVAGYVVESDPGRLAAIAEAGNADIVEAYREVVG